MSSSLLNAHWPTKQCSFNTPSIQNAQRTEKRSTVSKNAWNLLIGRAVIVIGRSLVKHFSRQWVKQVVQRHLTFLLQRFQLGWVVFLHVAQRNNPGNSRHHTQYGLPTRGTKKQPRKSQASHSVWSSYPWHKTTQEIPGITLRTQSRALPHWDSSAPLKLQPYSTIRICSLKHYYYHYPLKQKNITYCNVTGDIPSVLWRCWLGGRKGIRPVKNWVVGCWHGYLSGARCRLAYDPADATATHCLLLQ